MNKPEPSADNPRPSTGRDNQMAAVYKASLEINAQLDETALLQTIVRKAAELIETGYSGLFLLEPDHTTLNLAAGYNQPEQYLGCTLRVGEGLAGRIIQTGEPQAITDYRAWEGGMPPDIVGPIGRILGVPLKRAGNIIGVLNVFDKEAGVFPESAIPMLSVFAAQAAIAIENTRLFEQTRRWAQQLAVFNELAREMTGILDVAELCKVVTERVCATFGYTDVSIFTVDPQARRVILQAVTGAYASVLVPGQYTQAFGEGVIGTVAETGRLVVVNNPQEFPGFILLNGTNICSEAAIPLKVGHETIGVLNVESTRPNAFDKSDLAALATVADQLAVALEKARLFDETRRRAEQIEQLHRAAKKQARQVQQILDAVQEGIIFLDATHRVQLANPAGREHLAVLAEIGPGEILTRLGVQPLTRLLESTGRNQWHKITGPSPWHRLFEIAAHPIAAGPDNIEGWVMVSRDVTEERRIQSRIQQQERLAAVGQLAAGIAHDFNNILTGIIGYTELIRADYSLSETAREDLGHIIQQGQRAAHLIRQILDFSRQTVTERRPVDFAVFLKDTLRLLERTIPEDIRLELEIDPGRETYILKADPVRLQQALTNLAVNARDAMPSGGQLKFCLTAFTVTPAAKPPHPDMLPGSWIALSISDTGTGIPPDAQRHLFEPFFTTKAVGQGTGLGLAQVYGIVKQHDGFIEVESEEGQGTTFTLYLPMTSMPETTAASPPEECPPGYGELILVVEDDPAVLKTTASMLTYLGYRVIRATNGQEALELYTQHRSDVAMVLTDLTMPRIGGVGLSQILADQNPEIKVVAMTGYLLETEAKELLDNNSSIIDWLQKPLSLEILAQTIHRALNPNKAAA